MRFQLILEDENGDQIDMTATANQYMTSSIDGLYPPAGTISTAAYAGMNGSYLNNAFIEKRNIVINFQMRGVNIEKRRHMSVMPCFRKPTLTADSADMTMTVSLTKRSFRNTMKQLYPVMSLKP